LRKLEPQFLEQFQTGIAFDLRVVKTLALSAFQFTQLDEGQGVVSSKNQLVNPSLGAQSL
jgi:hypothetical protein